MADATLGADLDAGAGNLDDDGAAGAKVDGRHARRERNREAVVDAVLAMFAEEMLVPTIEKAAERSGLSLRSVYRYFPDPEALTQAAVERQLELVRPLATLHAIGEGPLDARLDAFARMRVRLYERVGPTYRATLHHEAHNARLRENLYRTRQQLSDQFERQFAPEIEALSPEGRRSRVVVADLLSQFESIDHLRRYRRLTIIDTTEAVVQGLRAVLTAPI